MTQTPRLTAIEQRSLDVMQDQGADIDRIAEKLVDQHLERAKGNAVRALHNIAKALTAADLAHLKCQQELEGPENANFVMRCLAQAVLSSPNKSLFVDPNTYEEAQEKLNSKAWSLAFGAGSINFIPSGAKS